MRQLLKRVFLYILLLSGLFVSSKLLASSWVQTLPPRELVEAYATAGIQGDYDMARFHLERIRRVPSDRYDVDTWTDLYELGLIVSEYVDYGDSSLLQCYDSLRVSVHDRFMVQLENSSTGEDSVAILFGLATLEAIEATRLDSDGQMLASYRAMLRHSGNLEQLLEIDSSFVDARLGIATVTYIQSKILGWTPFLKDRRDEAIEQIIMVARDGVYSRFLAVTGLTWIYVEEDQQELAIEWAESWMQEVGEIRNLLRPCAKAYFQLERWEEAEDRYSVFLASLRSMRIRNHPREIGTLHMLAQISYEQERWQSVIDYAEEAFSLPLTDEQQEDTEDLLNRFGRLARRAERQLERQD